MEALKVWPVLAEDRWGGRYELSGYSEPTWNGEGKRKWARDREGHWYSFDGDSELVESSSGRWFTVIPAAH